VTEVTLLPIFILLTSLGVAPLIFALPESSARLRTGLNLAPPTKVALVIWLGWKVANGVIYDLAFPVLPGLEFSLQADPLAMLFIALSAVLWLLTTIYAVGYLEKASAPQPLLRLLQPLRRGDRGHRHGGQPLHLPDLLRGADARDLSAGRPSRHGRGAARGAHLPRLHAVGGSR
jgi:hypothetical protein